MSITSRTVLKIAFRNGNVPSQDDFANLIDSFRHRSDDFVSRGDLNISETGKALITNLVAGEGIELVSTGADVGTGEVTIRATGGGTGSSRGIDGGGASTVFLESQLIDGGGA